MARQAGSKEFPRTLAQSWRINQRNSVQVHPPPPNCRRLGAFLIRFIAGRLRATRQGILWQSAGIPTRRTRKGCDMTGLIAAASAGRSILARLTLILLAATLANLPATAMAQTLERMDPDQAFSASPQSGGIDADLMGEQPAPAPLPPAPAPPPPVQPVQTSTAAPDDAFLEDDNSVGGWTEADVAQTSQPPVIATPAASSDTYGEDDLIGAAEDVFGKGAEGLAKMIEGLLAKQGRPNGYIVGREAGGAFIFGARYGSGTLHHKIEGDRKVYWTGPSVGFDAGANAANTFVLVYNLYDSEDLYSRFAAGEGQAYLIGGLHASYLRKGDVVLIPIRMGAGLRLGINAGYMKFSEKQRWSPF
jgi:hypothetical protein